jgi:hypothetical protein
MSEPYWPLIRYPYKNCKILVCVKTTPPKAEVLVIEDEKAFKEFGDFLLAHGLKSVAKFEAETWRKAKNKAMRWADEHQELLKQEGGKRE